jgi:hypothetical protein
VQLRAARSCSNACRPRRADAPRLWHADRTAIARRRVGRVTPQLDAFPQSWGVRRAPTANLSAMRCSVAETRSARVPTTPCVGAAVETHNVPYDGAASRRSLAPRGGGVSACKAQRPLLQKPDVPPDAMNAPRTQESGAFRMERVTGIEPALSAWENQRQTMRSRRNPAILVTPRILIRPWTTVNDRRRPSGIARLSHERRSCSIRGCRAATRFKSWPCYWNRF